MITKKRKAIIWSQDLDPKNYHRIRFKLAIDDINGDLNLVRGYMALNIVVVRSFYMPIEKV
jgi:hypothetical protein